MKHVDVGEKIGGARKDYYRDPLRSEDCSAMNVSELQTHVRKANIWPTLDMEALRERGMTPHAAAFIKIIKDALPFGPQNVSRLENETSEAYVRRCSGDYLKVVTSMRDALMDPKIRTAEDVLKAFGRTMKTLMNVDEVTEKNVRIQPEDIIHQAFDHKPFRRALRRVESELITSWAEKREPKMQAGIWNLIGTKVRLTTDENDDWKSQEDELWAGLGTKKRSQDPEAAQKRKELKEMEDELKRPHLEHVVVEGQRRDLRRHVDADELMKEFGFRAIEFGNWLPDDERQQVLDFAYDSFDMLAEALDVPRRAVGFDGRLAIAFGSRGTAGAHAHFEPLREVINLTRLKGAGCLAHEWCHAYDHFQTQGRAGVQQPDEKEKIDFNKQRLSESPRFSKSLRQQEYSKEYFEELAERHLRESIRNSSVYCAAEMEMRKTVESIIYDFASALSKDLAKTYGGRIHDMLLGRSADPKDAKDMDQEILNRVNRLFEPLRDLGGWHYSAQNCLSTKVVNLVESVSFTRAVRMKATTEIIKAEKIESIPAAKGSQFTYIGTVYSRFYRDAQELDAKRSKKYWSTDVEMFARAGACAIYDKMTALGKRNDYLHWGVDEERYGEDIPSPNTQGKDRAALNRVFDQEFGQWRKEVQSLACEPIIKTGEVKKPEPVWVIPDIQRGPNPEKFLSMAEVEELRTMAQNLSHLNVRSGGDDMGLGGLFSEPLVLSAKISAAHYGKVVVQTLEDGNLMEGGYLGYQLLPLENFDDCIKDNHLVAQGVPLSAKSVMDKTEIAVDPSEESRIFMASSAQLEREILSARQLDFEPWINKQAEEQIMDAMRQGEPGIRKRLEAAQVFVQKQETRRGRVR